MLYSIIFIYCVLSWIIMSYVVSTNKDIDILGMIFLVVFAPLTLPVCGYCVYRDEKNYYSDNSVE